MVTGLFDFIMKVAVEKRPYATKIAMITPDKEEHEIVSLWAGSGAGADPICRIDELVKENQALKKDIIRLEKEKTRLEGELKRVNDKLNNERFMSKAPENVVNEEKEKLQKYQLMMEKVLERLEQMKK